MKNTIIALSFAALTATLCLPARAQEPAPPKEPARGRVQRPAQKAEPKAKQVEEPLAEPTPEEAMRKTLSDLSAQIGALNSEIKSLRQTSDRHSLALELLLGEERLARSEDKLDEASQHKAELDAREADILRRQKNIQQEITMRGFIRRDQGEAILRDEFARALDDIHSQQQQSQQRVADLQSQVSRLRSDVETRRRKLDRLEGKEVEDK